MMELTTDNLTECITRWWIVKRFKFNTFSLECVFEFERMGCHDSLCTVQASSCDLFDARLQFALQIGVCDAQRTKMLMKNYEFVFRINLVHLNFTINTQLATPLSSTFQVIHFGCKRFIKMKHLLCARADSQVNKAELRLMCALWHEIRSSLKTTWNNLKFNFIK